MMFHKKAKGQFSWIYCSSAVFRLDVVSLCVSVRGCSPTADLGTHGIGVFERPAVVLPPIANGGTNMSAGASK